MICGLKYLEGGFTDVCNFEMHQNAWDELMDGQRDGLMESCDKASLVNH